MRPTEIKLKKVKNKLASMIYFFAKDSIGKKLTPEEIETVRHATRKAVRYAISVGWIKEGNNV